MLTGVLLDMTHMLDVVIRTAHNLRKQGGVMLFALQTWLLALAVAPNISWHIMSCHTIPYHITSYHITSWHGMPSCMSEVYEGLSQLDSGSSCAAACPEKAV